MDFLKKPFARDTSTNSADEVLRRLAVVLHVGGPTAGTVLAGIGAWRGSISQLWVGATLIGTGLALHFTRRVWRGGETTTPATPSDTTNSSAWNETSVTAPARRPRILLLNASLNGANGNSAGLLARVETRLASHAELSRASLAGPEAQNFAKLVPLLRAADGFALATGTHWDSWSSPLQRFLEDATPSEATELWLGKPVAVLVSEHSTGGKGVLSRLQGVLVTYGCTIPPLSGLVVSKCAQIAGRAAPREAEDFWCADDLEVVADNLLGAARQPRPAWRSWPVDRTDYAKVWFKG